jgi:predicted nucleotidyltransferase
MHTLIETHRHEIRALAARRGITEVRVFGSMARGDAGDESDVDLLVSVPAGVSGFALGGLLLDLQDLLGRRVDILTEGGLHPALRQRVLSEAQML